MIPKNWKKSYFLLIPLLFRKKNLMQLHWKRIIKLWNRVLRINAQSGTTKSTKLSTTCRMKRTKWVIYNWKHWINIYKRWKNFVQKFRMPSKGQRLAKIHQRYKNIFIQKQKFIIEMLSRRVWSVITSLYIAANSRRRDCRDIWRYCGILNYGTKRTTWFFRMDPSERIIWLT